MTAEPDTFSLLAAEAFVDTHGTSLEKATWKAGFGWGPVEVLIFELEPHLDAQGVWSGLVPNEGPGGLASVIAAMRLFGAVNLGEDIFEVGARTQRQLRRRRSADGSWDAPGPWPGVGDGPARRAWYTAAVGALAGGITGSADPAEGLLMRDGAARWLRDHQAKVAEWGPATCWMALACLGAAPDRDAATARALLALEARLLRWLEAPRPASDLAWIHEAARQAGMPSEATLRRRTRQRLASSQFVSGGWAGGSDAGWPVSSAAATFQACRALVRA